MIAERESAPCAADHDDRVVPLHSYKMIATLQHTLAAYPGSPQRDPLLLRVDHNAGHGGGERPRCSPVAAVPGKACLLMLLCILPQAPCWLVARLAVFRAVEHTFSRYLLESGAPASSVQKFCRMQRLHPTYPASRGLAAPSQSQCRLVACVMFQAHCKFLCCVKVCNDAG